MLTDYDDQQMILQWKGLNSQATYTGAKKKNHKLIKQLSTRSKMWELNQSVITISVIIIDMAIQVLKDVCY